MLTLLATIRTPALLIIGLLAPMRFRAPSTASEACNAIRNERVTERFYWKSILYEGSNSASGLAFAVCISYDVWHAIEVDAAVVSLGCLYKSLQFLSLQV